MGETVSLAEGGVRVKNEPVELETEVIMRVKQKENHTQRQEYQLDKFRMATARWVAVPSKGDLEFVEDQKVVDQKSTVSWCLKKWIMDVHGAVQCPGLQPAGMK